MATVLGVIQAAQATGGTSNWVTPGYIRSEPHVNVDYYVALGTETAGTVIKMSPPLDTGSMVLYFLLNISAVVNNLTFSIGDLNSATRYATAVSAAVNTLSGPYGGALSSTGPYITGSNPLVSGIFTPTSTNDDRQIILTSGGATLTVSTVVSLMTVYTCD